MEKTAVMYISNEASLGGAARSLMDMLSVLKAKVKPYVIIPGFGIIENELRTLGIEYYVVPFTLGYGIIGSHNKLDEDRNFRDNYHAALTIIELAKDKNIKLIHSNTSVSNVGAFVSLLLDVPHVWHIRELLEEHYGYELWDISLKLKLFKETDAIISISKCVQSNYKEKYGFDSETLYDGLDTGKYIQELDSEPEHRTSNTFLLAGNISAGKGQFDAVRALEIVVNKGVRDARLLIIGNGTHNYLWGIKRYIRLHGLTEFIHILPFQEELTSYRENAGFAIVSSKMEALGRVTAEAMLAGNIVIGADTGGTYELIGPWQDRGYLYRQGDYESLAEKMLEAIQDNICRKEDIRKKAQAFAIENFSLKAYSEKLIDIYTKLTDSWNAKKHPSRKELLNSLETRYKQSIDFNRENRDNKEVNSNSKFRQMFYMADKWLRIRQRGQNLSIYFQEKGIHTIAIYGLGYLGCDLLDELEDSHVEVSYVIDRNNEECSFFINAVNPEDDFDKVDAIVITVAGEEGNISDYLKSKGAEYVISLKEVLDSYQV